jgi:hypothetical protein
MTVSHAPSIDPDRRRAERLEIARKLYEALVALDRDRMITLCDGDGQVVARHDLRPKADLVYSSAQEVAQSSSPNEKSRREHWE